jgi:hypothetical protein
MTRRISPSLTRSLSAALKDLHPLTRDTGVIALARRYAALIDQAQVIADRLDDLDPENDSQVRMIAALRARVDAQAVASDLGPKFLAALAALGMTPAARASVTRGGTPDVSTVPGGDALARLRDAHRR